MILTAKQVAMAVVHSRSIFNLRTNDCVVANVSWGLFSWGEADLIALTKSGYLIEGEIKLTKSDFLADKDKKKWKEGSEWPKDIKRFFYIVPDYLADFALENTDHGVISVSISETGTYSSKVKRDSKYNKGRKFFIEEKMQLMRLGAMRAWKN